MGILSRRHEFAKALKGAGLLGDSVVIFLSKSYPFVRRIGNDKDFACFQKLRKKQPQFNLKLFCKLIIIASLHNNM